MSSGAPAPPLEPRNDAYAFGPFLLEARERRLLRDGQPVPVTVKVFDLLEVLVRRPGRLLLKEDLLSLVWPDAAVEENNLTVTMSALRKALGEAPADRHYVETVPRRGYRFVADVREVPEPEAGGRTPVPVATASPAGEAAVDRPRGRPRTPLVAITIAAVVAASIAASTLWRRPPSPAVLGAVPSVAVLPFHSLTGPEDEYLGLGMADTLITRLGSTRTVIVRSTGTVRRYVRSDVDPVAAGRELGVDAVLEGSIQSAAGRLRASMRMLRVSDGATLWAESFDERAGDIFRLQDSISERVSGALALPLTEAQRTLLTRRDTEDVDAYHLYLKGRFFWNKRTREGFQRGLALFEQAVERDPGYARAHVGVADSYIGQAYYEYGRPQQAMPRARTAVLKALAIAPTLSEAHASLAHIKGNYEWDWAAAEQEWRRAISLDPDYATAHQWYAVHYLTPAGRLDEALREARRAQQLEPLSPVFNSFLGATLLFSRRPDEAIEECRKAIDLYPEFGVGHWYLGRAYLQKGQPREALTELEEAVRLSGGSPLMQATLAAAHAAAGDPDHARQVLRDLVRLRNDHYASAVGLAVAHAALGERDEALRWLEEAAAERDFHLVYLKVWPEFDTLRAEPRFAALVRRVGLAP
jgi:DNA-binding winged helix-turn-helix (wHTH) protein/TolB-like protein/Tfp pilus assembly protein PilF